MLHILRSNDGIKWMYVCSIKDIETAFRFATDLAIRHVGFMIRIIDSFEALTPPFLGPIF